MRQVIACIVMALFLWWAMTYRVAERHLIHPHKLAWLIVIIAAWTWAMFPRFWKD